VAIACAPQGGAGRLSAGIDGRQRNPVTQEEEVEEVEEERRRRRGEERRRRGGGDGGKV